MVSASSCRRKKSANNEGGLSSNSPTKISKRKRTRPVKHISHFFNDDGDNFFYDDCDDDSSPPLSPVQTKSFQQQQQQQQPTSAAPAPSAADLEEYRSTTLFKNAILKITTNIEFDLDKIVNLFSGQITRKIPSARVYINISCFNHSILVYKSGIIVVTNVYFFNNLATLYDFFNSFFFFVLVTGICSLKPDDEDELASAPSSSSSSSLLLPEDTEDDKVIGGGGSSSCFGSRRKLRASFMVENLHFSFLVNECQLFSTFNQNYSAADEDDGRRKRSIVLACQELQRFLKSRPYFSSYHPSTGNCPFPAEIFKFEFKRLDHNLVKFKSQASKKRHKNTNFQIQKISLHFFENFKFILTGGQTREDMHNLRGLLEDFFTFCFKTNHPA
jgi:hypothetical protein